MYLWLLFGLTALIPDTGLTNFPNWHMKIKLGTHHRHWQDLKAFSKVLCYHYREQRLAALRQCLTPAPHRAVTGRAIHVMLAAITCLARPWYLFPWQQHLKALSKAIVGGIVSPPWAWTWGSCRAPLLNAGAFLTPVLQLENTSLVQSSALVSVFFRDWKP